MKLFSESLGRLLENLRSIEGCGKTSVMDRSSKFCRSLWQDVSKVLIVAKLKLVVVPKKKGVSKLKMQPLEKFRFGGAGTLTALTACNDEILRNLALFGQDLQPISQIWCL